MALMCDGTLQDGPCRRPAVTSLNVQLRDRTLTMDLCEPCAQDLEQTLIAGGVFCGGAHVVGASVNYKPRNAYVAASGRTFTAVEAREWLVDRGIANSRGRLSKDQLKAFADAH
jgi:hypothetical protein